MIAPTPSQRKSFRLKVRRQDGPDSSPYWQTFEIQYRPGMNIVSCLQDIAANPVTVDGEKTTPIIYDVACLEEVCGSCTALVNGYVCQMCSQLVDDYLKQDDTITLEPMTKFPIIRDLSPDRSRLFEDLKKIRGWVPIDGTYDLGPGPTESPAQQEIRYALSRCISCGCCLEACPQYTRGNDFVGAAIISQVRYFNRHATGAQLQGERLDAMAAPGGIADCGNAQNCVKVCPKEIPLTESIAEIGRRTTTHAIRKFFTG